MNENRAMNPIRGRMLAVCLLVVGVVLPTSCLVNQASGDDAAPRTRARAASKTTAKHTAGPNPFPRRKKVADDFFDGGAGWLNVSGPIEMRDLRGKIVVLDFWTFCCINCMHILPDLKFLEEKYPRELVVIGVHSAKFDNEKDSENIRQAILRYDIKHPVINDSNMVIWNKMGVSSWPTFALIDPEGYFVGAVSSEGHRDDLDKAIAKLISYHKAHGTLDRSPLRLGLELHKQAVTPLKFPGKILADEKSGRLFIADSNHNRIVICTLAGKLIDVAGSGSIGKANGPFATASFHHPQGMALDGSKLYVADTENHMVRILDLDKKKVSTLAGTGNQASFRAAGGLLRGTPLNSPWDLMLVRRTLYVAMAGCHQIWSHTLGSDGIHVFAGNGREDIQNGPYAEASFAQPSGLATDGNNLFVADSEGSAIRAISLGQGASVRTLAGTSNLSNGQSLFAFGDKDDVGQNARFQHPLGLAYDQGRLFVADTYNHKIKVVDVRTGAVSTWLGSGKRGDKLEPAEFSEPGGLAVAEGKLFIADTNNHAIKIADLESRQVKQLEIEGLEPPVLPPADDDANAPKSAAIRVEPQRVAAGDSLKLTFSFKLPSGFKLNTMAPATCRLHASQATSLISSGEMAKHHRAVIEGDKATVSIPLAAKSGKADIEASLSFTYCREGVGGLCKLGMAHWAIPIDVSPDADQTAVNLTADVREN